MYGAEGLLDRMPGGSGSSPEARRLGGWRGRSWHTPSRTRRTGGSVGGRRAHAEYSGREDRHPYELFLQIEEIEHRKTKVGRPQSNGLIGRFHRTLLDEHLRVKGRTTWYESIEEMQTDLDA